jgi:hypothetical protein
LSDDSDFRIYYWPVGNLAAHEFLSLRELIIKKGAKSIKFTNYAVQCLSLADFPAKQVFEAFFATVFSKMRD